MKKTLSFLCATILISCGNNIKQQKEEIVADTVITENSIGTLREMHINKSITIADQKYVYKYDFVRDESLPIVRNPQGDDYYDNKVTLSIKTKGREIFSQTFTKKDFSKIVPEKFMTNSALIGFTYNYAKTDTSDALYFIATVGDPDETADMVYPIQIRITPQGNMTMEKAPNLDTEPINPMTLDPADDIGV